VVVNKEHGQFDIHLQATSNKLQIHTTLLEQQTRVAEHNIHKNHVACLSRREVQFLCLLSDSWVISRLCEPTGYNILLKPFFSKSGESRIHRCHLYAMKVMIISRKYYDILNLRRLTYFGNLLS
jgi:hypothetical protein